MGNHERTCALKKKKLRSLKKDPFFQLNSRIITCKLCPRLRKYCLKIAKEKRAAYRDWQYWGNPLPGFGDLNGRLLLLGLAPASHGGNRTGRIFTGDRSGGFLIPALFRAGFANQPVSVSQDDGLKLINCYMTAVVRCAPPKNKPVRQEFLNCRPYLKEELKLLKNIKVILALGSIAFHQYLDILKEQKEITTKNIYKFAHGAVYKLPRDLPRLIASYHPSQQNTLTGRLTQVMMDNVLKSIVKLLILFLILR